ncbi:hypothetical protein GCM10027035_17860 [Emticicia sediminis]
MSLFSTYKLKKLTLLVFLCFSNLIFAQHPLIKSQNCFGGSLNDDGDYSSLTQTNDGGYIVTTSTKSNDGDISGNHGNYDIWAIKFNSNDQVEWKKSFGGTNDEYGSGVIQSVDGGFLFYCASASNNGDVTGNHGSVDFWLLKTDISGNILWQKSYGGSNWDFPTKGIQTNDGGFLIGGISSSNNGDVSANHGSGYVYDIWLLKISNMGVLEWQKCLGGSSDETRVGEIIENSNSYTILGTTMSIDGDVVNTKSELSTWIFNIDKINKNIIWQKVDNCSSNCFSNLKKMSDGNLILFGVNNNKLVIRKLNSFGNIIMQSILLNNQFYDLSINDLEFDSDGGFIFIGSERTSRDSFNNLYIVKFDVNFTISWQKSYGGSGDDLGMHFFKRNNDFVIYATSTSNDSDVNNNHGGVDIWLLRLSYNIETIKIDNPVNPLVACSNGNTYLSITFNTENITSTTFTAQLSDVNGSFGNPYNIGSSNTGVISIQIPSNLVAGNYRIRIMTPNILSYNYSNIVIQTSIPSASISGINLPNEIFKGQSINYQIDFIGNMPITYSLSNGIEGLTSTSSLSFTSQIQDKNPIRITNLNNSCGNGTIGSELSFNFNKYCFVSSSCSFSRISTFILYDNGNRIIEKTNSGCSSNGWGKFTNLEGLVNAGNSYEFDVNAPGQRFSIWIDFNRDSTFTQSELAYTNILPSNSSMFRGTISIPNSAIDGKTLMRIIAEYSYNNNTQINPCNVYSYGETEDYTLNIVSPCKLNLNLLSSISESETFNVQNSIKASNIIHSNVNVIFNSGKKIELNSGFETKNGSVFSAFIQGCGNN